MIKQLAKLEDVISIRRHAGDHAVFGDMEGFFEP